MFTYVTEPFEIDESFVPTHIGRVRAGIRDKKALLAAAGEALSFSGFFGKNLDAFWDMLRDLPEELPRRIFLVHDDLPDLPDGDLHGYLETLQDACQHWSDRDEYEFEVIFPYSTRDAVLRLMATSE